MSTLSKSPWTRHFRHLLPRRIKRPIPGFSKSSNPQQPAKTKDKIKQWNIVPGDQVRIVRALNSKDPVGAIREVLSIDKMVNWVYLKGAAGTRTIPGINNARHVHYSNLQLYLGEREFPPKPGEDEPQRLPVFAKRIACTRPHYIPALRRYMWNRYAVSTTPPLPDIVSSKKILIPWPIPEKTEPVAASIYDTPSKTVLRQTWKPSLPIAPKTSLEDTYLTQLRSGQYDPSLPMEHYLVYELSNPHSRAKKQARWQDANASRLMLKTRFITDELNNLDGRTRAEARKEGVFKWEKHVAQAEKDRSRRRAVQRGAEQDLQRKLERKERKKRRIGEKLRSLVLKDEPNQVVPGTAHSVTL